MLEYGQAMQYQYGQPFNPRGYAQPQMQQALQPPVVSMFRQGVCMNARGEALIEVGKQYFKEFISSMHNGRVAECIEAWMADDVEWYSERLPLPLRARGKVEACKLYNIVLEKVMGGPQSTVTMHADEIKYIPQQDVVRMDFTTSVKRSGCITPFVESKRFSMKFNREMKISRVVVSPPENYKMSIGANPDACISPVVVNAEQVAAHDGKFKKCDNNSFSSSEGLTTTSSESGSAPALQPPCCDRPCLHNNWDSVRVKRGYALLRCRTCASQWKLPAAQVTRCPKYLAPTGCNLGTLCSTLHVNTRKQTYEERTGLKLPVNN
eukprot:TRINITY_DN3149_c0_g2_i1.p1 TRINITY_DN3149_c0_g2~~TRINITY_DN3149_c0_g2_i1.p1  ORF type:complete len:322 (+),score=66.90 TRINITY_DN3149_c0_g2_i1:95-1060(+)